MSTRLRPLVALALGAALLLSVAAQISPTPSPSSASRGCVGLRIWLQANTTTYNCLNFFELQAFSTAGQNVALDSTTSATGTFPNVSMNSMYQYNYQYNYASYGIDGQINLYNTVYGTPASGANYGQKSNMFVNTNCLSYNEWWQVYWDSPVELSVVNIWNRLDGGWQVRLLNGAARIYYMAPGSTVTSPIFYGNASEANPSAVYAPWNVPASASTSTMVSHAVQPYSTVPRPATFSFYSQLTLAYGTQLPRYVRLYAAPGKYIQAHEVEIYDENNYNVALKAPVYASSCNVSQAVCVTFPTTGAPKVINDGLYNVSQVVALRNVFPKRTCSPSPLFPP